MHHSEHADLESTLLASNLEETRPGTHYGLVDFECCATRTDREVRIVFIAMKAVIKHQQTSLRGPRDTYALMLSARVLRPTVLGSSGSLVELRSLLDVKYAIEV